MSTCVNINSCINPDEFYDITKAGCLPYDIQNIHATFYTKTNPTDEPIVMSKSEDNYQNLQSLKNAYANTSKHITAKGFDIFEDDNIVMCENYNPVIHTGCVEITQYDQSTEYDYVECLGIKGNSNVRFEKNDSETENIRHKNLFRCEKRCDTLGDYSNMYKSQTYGMNGKCEIANCESSNYGLSSGSYYGGLQYDTGPLCLPCTDDIACEISSTNEANSKYLTLNNVNKNYTSSEPCLNNSYITQDNNDAIVLRYQKKNSINSYDCYYDTIIQYPQRIDAIAYEFGLEERRCGAGMYKDNDGLCKTCSNGTYYYGIQEVSSCCNVPDGMKSTSDGQFYTPIYSNERGLLETCYHSTTTSFPTATDTSGNVITRTTIDRTWECTDSGGSCMSFNGETAKKCYTLNKLRELCAAKYADDDTSMGLLDHSTGECSKSLIDTSSDYYNDQESWSYGA